MNTQKLKEIIVNSSKDWQSFVSFVVIIAIISSAWVYTEKLKIEMQQKENTSSAKEEINISELEEIVIPTGGVILPVVWGDLGLQLANSGVIDVDKFKSIYEQRGIFTNEYKNLLLGSNNGQIKITRENSGYYLNLFWALGLANKNEILETGEMVDPRYGGARNFASTGGWSLSKGNVMDHYSMHKFFSLTTEQQIIVDRISRGIYRPCCNNSTHFPDCNHGMAMLGLLELMASQGVGEQDMWKVALIVNSYWFPDTYLTIATYMKNRGIEWKDINPQEILGINYSSGQGYKNIASQIVLPKQQQNGCSI